jgi:hypothetical protein
MLVKRPEAAATRLSLVGSPSPRPSTRYLRGLASVASIRLSAMVRSMMVWR